MKLNWKKIQILHICALSALGVITVKAQSNGGFVSTALTDEITNASSRFGGGVIDLLKDVSGSQLSSYLNQNGGLLMLGADLNERSSRLETSNSVGIAIKEVQLFIETADSNTVTFSDVFTSTTATLRDRRSSTANQYNTLFGQQGDNTLVGENGFDLTSFDDVLWLEDVNVMGEITRAILNVSFLRTEKRSSANPTDAEDFFDFTRGNESFALLSAADAITLEAAAIGQTEATLNALGGSSTLSGDSVAAAISSITPAAPAPPFIYMALFGGVLLFKRWMDNRV